MKCDLVAATGRNGCGIRHDQLTPCCSSIQHVYTRVVCIQNPPPLSMVFILGLPFSSLPLLTCSLLSVGFSARVQGNPTYDVLLQSPDPTSTAIATASSPSSITADARQEDATERELTGLSASSLSALQPFELDQTTEDIEMVAEAEVALTAERLKDGGNTLFKLGDTDAAAEMFARVLRTLERTPVVGK